MARIRSIKPEFWTSAQVMECSMIARLMFVGMWNFADDCGRLPLSPKTIKAQIFPSDDVSTENILGMIRELSDNGLLLTYIVEGKDYLQITGWQHQRIDKPQPAKYPAPVNGYSKNVPGMIATDLKGEDRKGREPIRETRASALDDWPWDYREQFWTLYPHKVGKADAIRKLDAVRKRAIPVPWQTLMDGLQNYIRTKPPDRPWCNPATWLHQDRWTDQPANVSSENGKTGSIIAAADNLVSIIDGFGDGARSGDGICGEAGPPHVRLLSQG